MTVEICVACKELFERGESTRYEASAPCRSKYPPALIKACCDYFEYALKVRTGETFLFVQAHIDGEFVHLDLTQRPDGHDFGFHRGVEVRIADITWVADGGK